MKKHQRINRRAMAAAISLMLLSGAVTAQDATPPAGNPGKQQSGTQPTTQDLDEVVVTGSCAPTTVGQSTTPVTVISAQTLQATGQANLRDALVRLSPSISNTTAGGDNADLTDALQRDEVRYGITSKWQVALGANNLFNKYPSRLPFVIAGQGQMYDTMNSQAGYDGGYYYLRPATDSEQKDV